LLPHGDASPEVARSAWVAPGAFVIGDVHLGEDSSVWYGAVLRGDTEPIRIGARTNIQDEGRDFPPRSLIVGIPAKRVSDVNEEQTSDIERGVRVYIEHASAHRKSLEESRYTG
jgi:carbonic anhydrase/acetyltransferase-like protein (isoleucine patch superfamily)